MNKIKKIFLISLISIVVIYFSFIFLLVISLAIGPSKDDRALFYGKKYSISKTPNGYSLFDNDVGEIIPNVRGYTTLNDKSYIINDTHIVTIDGLDGTYTIEETSKVDDFETHILKHIKKIELSQ